VERENKNLAAGFVAAAAALALFSWLATQVFRNSTMAMDAAVRDGLHAWASPPLTAFFRVVTQFGSELWIAPFGAFVVWRMTAAGRRHAAILVVIAVAGAEALDQVLKLTFHRARPEVFFGLTRPGTYSFPSGHAMVSACFYGVVAALASPRMRTAGQRAALWIGAAAAALLIGTSRIYLGVHYPSDVIAGYAAAIVWVFSVRAGYEVWRRRVSAGRPSAAREIPGREQTPTGTAPTPRSPDTRP
jgi:undecaprenyl-diphosphatase